MSRGKQPTKNASADGKHRKETKEERRVRLEKQAEARDRCFKMLPHVGGVLAVVLVAFAVWVHSMPPPAPAVLVQEATATTTTPPQQLNLEMLESLGPEVLARAGLTREDLEKMTFSTQETTASAASTSEADEKISLDDEEVPRQEEAPPSEDHNTATTIDEL